MSISSRLRIIFLLPLLLGVVLFGLLYWQHQEFTQLDQEAQQSALLMQHLFEFELLVNDYLRYPQAPRPGSQLLKKQASITNFLDQMSPHSKDPHWQQIHLLHHETERLLSKLMYDPAGVRSDQISAELRNHQVDLLVLNVRKLYGQAYQITTKTAVERDEVFHQINHLTIGANALVVLFLGGIAWWLIQNLLIRFRAMGRVCQVIAQGKLQTRFQAGQDDELGRLARTFNHMLDRLEETLTSKDALNREVAERTQAESRLREASEKYQSLFSNMQDGFAYHQILLGADNLPVDFLFLEANDCLVDILGKPVGEIVGHRASELIQELDQLEVDLVGILGAVALRGQSCRVEVQLPSRSKHLMLSAYSTSPGYFAVVYSDITNRRHDEQQLKKALKTAEASNRAKSSFLATISHELRVPLHGILGITSLMQNRGLTPEQSQQAAIVQQSGSALIQSLNGIVGLARIESHQAQVQHQPFNLVDLIEEEIERVAPAASNKGVELDFKLTDHASALVRSDPALLRQVLGNLLRNAVKYSPQGKVSVLLGESESSADRGRFRIDVIDNGPGVSEEERKYLFRAFEVAGAEGEWKASAAGLSLSVAAKLMGFLGGQIGLEERDGAGSQFWIELWLDKADPSEMPVEASHLPKGLLKSARLKARVLVVEDEMINQLVAKGMLESLGAQVETANEGAAALQKMQEQNFDLVLMDWRMPGMDGLEAVQLIRRRELDSNQHVPVIALTAAALFGDREQCLQAGMDDYLMKPFTFNDLEATVRRWL